MRLGLEHSPLWQLTLARWRAFYREPSALFWSFGFPLVLALTLGIAFRSRGPEPVFVDVEDQAGAAALYRALAARPELAPRLVDADTAQRDLRTGRVAVVVIPGQPRRYRFDPARPESRLGRALVDDALQRAEGRRDITQTSDAVITEHGARYIDFLVPGLIGMTLLSSGLWGVGYVIVDLRTRRLLKRLLATPMRRRDFLFAFVLLRAVFLLAELPILIAFATLVFQVPVRGSLVLVGALALLGTLAFAGLGLLCAARAENTQTVAGLINLVSMPMYIGSGVFFSAARFPEVVQPILGLLPLTALNDALRAVLLDGAGPGGVAAQALVLSVWVLGTFALALRRFRWR